MNIENLQVLISRRRKLQGDLESWSELVEDIDKVKEVVFQYPYKYIALSKTQNTSTYSGAIGDSPALESVKRTFALELKGKISETIGELNRVDKIIQDAENALLGIDGQVNAKKAS